MNYMKAGEIFREIFLLRKRQRFLERIDNAGRRIQDDPKLRTEFININKQIEDLSALLEKQKNN